MRWTPLLAFLALCACSATAGGSGRPVVVPGPPSPAGEPTPIAQRQPNVNHIHSLAVSPDGSRMLVGTHNGVSLGVGGAAPQPLHAPGLGGDVLQVLFAPDGLAYAAGHNLGVHVSRDGGATWANLSPEVEGLDVHGLAFDPNRPTHLFLYAVGKGMLVSTDGGKSWVHRAGYADQHYLTGLVVTADATMLAGSPELGLTASPDHGASFLAVRGGTGVIYSLAASKTNADVVLAACEFGIFLTQSGGKDWSVGLSSDPLTAVAVDPRNPTHFYAGGADGALFESADSGATWKSL